jgi:hypothetical protein
MNHLDGAAARHKPQLSNQARCSTVSSRTLDFTKTNQLEIALEQK